MKALGVTIKTPQLRNGYTYVYRGAAWIQSPSDEWEVVTRAMTGDERYVGERHIDGGPCYVWRSSDTFFAQPQLTVERPGARINR